MGPAYFVLAVLGCSDAETACREVRLVDVHYQNAPACMAAMDEQLSRNSDIAYPVVMGRCQPASPQMAERSKTPAG
jgi:hypothetical protein